MSSWWWLIKMYAKMLLVTLAAEILIVGLVVAQIMLLLAGSGAQFQDSSYTRYRRQTRLSFTTFWSELINTNDFTTTPYEHAFTMDQLNQATETDNYGTPWGQALPNGIVCSQSPSSSAGVPQASVPGMLPQGPIQGQEVVGYPAMGATPGSSLQGSLNSIVSSSLAHPQPQHGNWTQMSQAASSMPPQLVPYPPPQDFYLFNAKGQPFVMTGYPTMPVYPMNNAGIGQGYRSIGAPNMNPFPGGPYDMAHSRNGGYVHDHHNNMSLLLNAGGVAPTQMTQVGQVPAASMASAQSLSAADHSQQIVPQQPTTSSALQFPKNTSSDVHAEASSSSQVIGAEDDVSSGVQQAPANRAAAETKGKRAKGKEKSDPTEKSKKRTADDAEASASGTKKRKTVKATPKTTATEPKDVNRIVRGAQGDDEGSENETGVEEEEYDPNAKKGKGKKLAQMGEGEGRTQEGKSKDELVRRACQNCRDKKASCSFSKMKRQRQEDVKNPGLTCITCHEQNLVCTTLKPEKRPGSKKGWASAPRLLEMLRRDDERLLHRWCSSMLLKHHLVPERLENGKNQDVEPQALYKTNFDFLVSDNGVELADAFATSAISKALDREDHDKRMLPDTTTDTENNGPTVMTPHMDRVNPDYRLAIDLIDCRAEGAATEATYRTTREGEEKVEREIHNEYLLEKDGQQTQLTSPSPPSPQGPTDIPADFGYKSSLSSEDEAQFEESMQWYLAGRAPEEQQSCAATSEPHKVCISGTTAGPQSLIDAPQAPHIGGEGEIAVADTSAADLAPSSPPRETQRSVTGVESGAETSASTQETGSADNLLSSSDDLFADRDYECFQKLSEDARLLGLTDNNNDNNNFAGDYSYSTDLYDVDETQWINSLSFDLPNIEQDP
ncbi:hypothetical protein Micbo1qcDRAFT_176896 [Microdochium bolleyi]|uniref:Zn(2)-C6 fungal-type domain-containing protein n=1 Tax=Microdochium bolleyi TaxID=196109 RepID=A0A136IXI7_9PEZI|nr:hypothetical protein Micbo1qcDRAFT_176896 [Microdochium bolleyi]